MAIWIMSANPARYNHAKAFQEHGYIDWNRTRNFTVGDIVYIYCTKPISKVMYKTSVCATDIAPYDDPNWNVEHVPDPKKKLMRLKLIKQIDSELLAYSTLVQHGMRYPPQGPAHIKDELLNYLDYCFGGE